MTSPENQVCPQCGKSVQPYHMFCPWCDADIGSHAENRTLPLDEDAGSDSSKAAPAVEIQNCFSCGKQIENYHEFCPWCDIDLKNNTGGSELPEENKAPCAPGEQQSVNPESGEKSPATDRMQFEGHNDVTLQASFQPLPENREIAPGVVCTVCGNPLQQNFNVCNMCGTPVNQQTVLTAPNVNPNGVVALSSSTYTGIDASLVQATPHMAENQSAVFNCRMAAPLLIHFLGGKHYKKGEMGILEFQITNVSDFPLSEVEFQADSSVATEHTLGKKLSFTIVQGQSAPVNISGFSPLRSGSDVIKVGIKARVQGLCDLYLNCEMTIQVIDESRNDSQKNINVNISSSGPLIVDMEDALANVDKEQPRFHPEQSCRWVEVPVYWDEKKMEAEALYFPAACVDSKVFGFNPSDFIQNHMISPEDSVKAVLSDKNGTATYLFSGKILNLGRNPELNHIPSILHPLEQYRGQNAKVSRQHCRIVVKNNKVFINDLSSHGVFLNNSSGKIAKNSDVRLKHNDVISIAGVLSLKIKIFTDHEAVISVLMERMHNKTSERYGLVCRYLPLGADPGLPVITGKGNNIAGAFFYHPMQRQWCFREVTDQSHAGNDLHIQRFQEFIFGQTKHWLSIL